MIVITGSEGAIGRRLCPALEPVLKVDRAGHPHLRLDLTVDDLAPLMPALARAEAVIHLATSADPEAPIEAHIDAVIGCARLVRAALEVPVPRLVLASSDWAEPKAPGLRPGAYGQSKRAIEALAAAYGERPGASAVALRFGWVTDDAAALKAAPDWLRANHWDDTRLLAEVRAALA